MLEFIKEHWVQYLIGATAAALLGLGLSFYLGNKWSTPASVRAERVEAEERRGEEMDELDIDVNGASSDEE